MKSKIKHFEISIDTASVEHTRLMGRRIGGKLIPGAFLALTGDLGSGKTAFIQGLATGLEVPKSCYVTSPTYTLINEYPGKVPLFHIDLYRLDAGSDMEDLGLLDIFYSEAVTAVEWSDRLLSNEMPEKRLELFFAITGDNERKIRIIAYGLDNVDLIKSIEIQFD